VKSIFLLLLSFFSKYLSTSESSSDGSDLKNRSRGEDEIEKASF